jgi:hypothetical protein
MNIERKEIRRLEIFFHFQDLYRFALDEPEILVI